MTDLREPRRRSMVRRVSTVAAILLVSMGAQGGPGAGPRLAPGQLIDPRVEGAQTADGVAGAVSPAGPAGPRTRAGAAALAPAAATFTPSNVALSLELVKGGFDRPILVTNAGDGSGRLFVVEQGGLIKIVDGGATLATPFLDLRSAVSTGGEQGLLGLAFHPRYPTLPYIYVNFTDRRGTTIVNRYTVSANPNVIDRASGVRILTIAQPYPNHNGGNLAFGPDGYLYIGMGDGGSAGDPGNRAQNVNTLLGKMLRIDINHGNGTRHYRSPASNPYVGRTGLDEIWSIGLRNPWRWSFDRLTGQLWVGDVGQDRYEEIDRSSPRDGYPAGRRVNYGWSVMEGRACFKPMSGCNTSGKQLPQLAYAHAVAGADNCSVTGGFVYRGTADPVLVGGYVFGDFCSGRIWVISPTASAPVTPTLVRDATASPQLAISSFGEDEAGELYVCDLSGGTIYRIRATPKA